MGYHGSKGSQVWIRDGGCLLALGALLLVGGEGVRSTLLSPGDLRKSSWEEERGAKHSPPDPTGCSHDDLFMISCVPR